MYEITEDMVIRAKDLGEALGETVRFHDEISLIVRSSLLKMFSDFMGGDQPEFDDRRKFTELVLQPLIEASVRSYRALLEDELEVGLR
jgi:hypothetical protein